MSSKEKCACPIEGVFHQEGEGLRGGGRGANIRQRKQKFKGVSPVREKKTGKEGKAPIRRVLPTNIQKWDASAGEVWNREVVRGRGPADHVKGQFKCRRKIHTSGKRGTSVRKNGVFPLG